LRDMLIYYPIHNSSISILPTNDDVWRARPQILSKVFGTMNIWSLE
jgi:hypothetical protein